MESLGSTIKKARTLAGFTLREVEEATNISNAYLSQLENDKIKKPSADVLYKLSKAYKVDLGTFLRAAGVMQQEDTLSQVIGIQTSGAQNEITNSWVNRIASYAPTLTEAQQNEILDFINFIKSKKS